MEQIEYSITEITWLLAVINSIMRIPLMFQTTHHNVNSKLELFVEKEMFQV